MNSAFKETNGNVVDIKTSSVGRGLTIIGTRIQLDTAGGWADGSTVNNAVLWHALGVTQDTTTPSQTDKNVKRSSASLTNHANRSLSGDLFASQCSQAIMRVQYRQLSIVLVTDWFGA